MTPVGAVVLVVVVADVVVVVVEVEPLWSTWSEVESSSAWSSGGAGGGLTRLFTDVVPVSAPPKMADKRLARDQLDRRDEQQRQHEDDHRA